MEENQKTRSANYTPTDKLLLLEIVRKYLPIVENKGTNAELSRRKRIAWNNITRRYNAATSSAPRDWMQLRRLYENIKQRSKKSITEKFQKDISFEGMNGSVRLLMEIYNQIVELAGPDLRNKPNPFEDAGSYFDEDIKAEPDLNPLDKVSLCYDTEDNNTIKMGDPLLVEIPKQNILPCSSEDNFDDKISLKTVESFSSISANIDSAKERYYKMKLSNAKLERRILLRKEKMETEKYKLELDILRLRRQQLMRTVKK